MPLAGDIVGGVLHMILNHNRHRWTPQETWQKWIVSPLKGSLLPQIDTSACGLMVTEPWCGLDLGCCHKFCLSSASEDGCVLRVLGYKERERNMRDSFALVFECLSFFSLSYALIILKREWEKKQKNKTKKGGGHLVKFFHEVASTIISLCYSWTLPSYIKTFPDFITYTVEWSWCHHLNASMDDVMFFYCGLLFWCFGCYS